MTNSNTPQKPLYRVSFSRIKGKNDQGNDVLGKPKEIGAVWLRKSVEKQGAILDLDIIPTELVNRQGVIFLVPATDGARASQPDNGEPLPQSESPTNGGSY